MDYAFAMKFLSAEDFMEGLYGTREISSFVKGSMPHSKHHHYRIKPR